MDRFLQMADFSRLSGVGEWVREPRGLFALGAVAVLVIYGLSVGRTKALVSLLSIYVAYVLTALFPFLPWLMTRLPQRAQDGLGLVLFLVLYGVVFAVLSHSMRRTRLSLGEISLLQVLLISVVQIGLLAAICVSLLPSEFGERVFGAAQPYVGGARALWGWAAASLLILPLMRARRKE